MQDSWAGERSNRRLWPRWTDRGYFTLTRLRQAVELAIDQYVAGKSSREGPGVAVDLGCGTMPYRSLFAPFVERYIGADISTNAMATAEIDPLTGAVNLEIGVADYVVSTAVLEHVESPTVYLAEAWRISRPGALMVLATHGHFRYHPSPQDYWRWTGAGLQKLLEDNGWRTLKVTGVIGFAAAAMQMLEDSIVETLSPHVGRAFKLVTQPLVGLADHFYSPETRTKNALLYVVVSVRKDPQD